ncbi:hypothetical protein [Zhongshania sp. BJYM1]
MVADRLHVIRLINQHF